MTSSCQTLLPWTILQISEAEHTVADFFKCTVKPRIPGFDCELLSALIGQEKGSLDHVDASLPVVAVITSFGRFLKYSVSIISQPLLLNSEFSQPTDSQYGSTISTVIRPIHQRTNKDKLFNDILQFLESSNVTVRETEITTVKKFIILLRDIFWHIDCHHHVFQQRAQPIPAVFGSHFTNYNCPERSKHRKRLTANLSSDSLLEFSLELSTILHVGFWDKPGWAKLKPDFNSLLISISTYADYLVQKNKRMKQNHRSPTPIRELSEYLQLKFIAESCIGIPSSLKAMEEHILECQPYEATYITPFLPSDCVQKHRVVNCVISNGLSFPCILLIYSPGSNIGNSHFLWRVSSDAEVAKCFEESQPVVEQVKQKLPIYHSRAMRSVMYNKFGRITPGIKPTALRYFYKDLTGKSVCSLILLFYFLCLGDQSASTNLAQSEIDKRIIQLIDMEDSDIVYDLRALNGRERSQYDRFWDECQKFLNEDISDAVDDRRHGTITHLSRAISIRDFVNQVKQRCPEGTMIPSCEWVRLQFWPKTPSTIKSSHYTGRFKLKFMIQQRQFRHQHVDSHYAAACFRYMREYAINIRDFCGFISIDDKHKIKIGEPGYPVAAAERGRRVLVREDEWFTVGDHDFTKFSIVPSVVFIINIPEVISDSWFSGKYMMYMYYVSWHGIDSIINLGKYWIFL